MKNNRVVLLILILCIFSFSFLLGGCGKKGNSASENEASGNSVSQAAPRNEGIWNEGSDTTGNSGNSIAANSNTNRTVSGMTGPYSGNTNGVDYATGTVVVDFSSAETDMDKAALAKQAMAGQAYFSGKAVTVNDILTGYGQGEWSAIISPQNDVCVWYTGIREESEFKVNFVIYDDGTFMLDSITVDGAMVDDYTRYMDEVISR